MAARYAANGMISYPSASGRQVIMFSDPVLEHLARHRQLKPRDREAGGRLYARISLGRVDVDLATGPCLLDIRSRTRFIPNRTLARAEIRRQFALGLHYVGSWHTHPEPVPTPSGLDRDSIKQVFSMSDHQLAGLLMVIVGTTDAPEGLYVGIHDHQGLTQLENPLTCLKGWGKTVVSRHPVART